MDKDFKRCAAFHGHVCGGLTLGYKASVLGLALLKEKFSKDEEIVAVVDNSSCFADAVQVLTGCTFGKGNFFFRDLGKMNLTLLSRRTGRGVRLARKSGLKDAKEKEFFALMNQVLSGAAAPGEKKLLEKLKAARTTAMMKTPPAELFSVSPARIKLPAKAHIFDSRPCGACGEAVMATRLKKAGGRLLCRECADAEQPLVP